MKRCKVVRYDGQNASDSRLWHAYLHWARKEARFPAPDIPADLQAMVDDPASRISDETAAALRAVVFSCFALEYRLKRVLKTFNIPFGEREPFGKTFLPRFWKRLSQSQRWDGAGNCAPPPEWVDVEPHLRRLINIRNDIAHANYEETLQFISAGAKPVDKARELYNAVVDAIRLVNQGTGYDARAPKELQEYFRPLKV
jgi:hypothetical protein